MTHLRFKKPQSPFLSRIIRDHQKQREGRFNLLYTLEHQFVVAKSEDEWDAILLEECGIPTMTCSKEKKWATAVEQARADVSAKLYDRQDKNLHIARRMFAIVEEEKALAEKESRTTITENAESCKSDGSNIDRIARCPAT